MQMNKLTSGKYQRKIKQCKLMWIFFIIFEVPI